MNCSIFLKQDIILENKDIANIIKKTAKLMELFGENDFKIRSYQNAVFALEKIDQRLIDLSKDELEKIDGIGKSIATAIAEISTTGSLDALNKMMEQTPKGVLDMMGISGIGPKKIRILWKELGVETLDELKEACVQGKIAKLKGFGEKTQENILESVNYLMANKGKLHYATARKAADEILTQLQLEFTDRTAIAGDLRRRLEVIDRITFVTSIEGSKLKKYLASTPSFELQEKISGPFSIKAQYKKEGISCEFHLSDSQNFENILLRKSSSIRHLSFPLPNGHTLSELLNTQSFANEAAIYEAAKLPYIAPELREGLFEWELTKDGQSPRLVEDKDLKGILHNHSTYSDGKHSLKEMAVHCKDLGYQYLGISDHSKTAQYAGGLYENKIKEQHAEIARLNEELGPDFVIFKGIESDILPDGSLDYATEVLASFDFIVASVHAGLNMDVKKATERLITAISNPFTTILGHPTGRLLLRREGYPIDHKAVIDACAEYGVIIEINANPWRLDLDWRWVHYAIQKNVMISINPDAHEKDGYLDMQYGVCIGRKGGLTKEMTFNALGAEQVAEHFKKRKQRALSHTA